MLRQLLKTGHFTYNAVQADECGVSEIQLLRTGRSAQAPVTKVNERYRDFATIERNQLKIVGRSENSSCSRTEHRTSLI